MSTVHCEILPFSGKNRNIKNVWSPPQTLCHRLCTYNNNLPLGNIALQYVIPNNCRKVWWCFLMNSCTFWRSRFFFFWIHQNYIVALTWVSHCQYSTRYLLLIMVTFHAKLSFSAFYILPYIMLMYSMLSE